MSNLYAYNGDKPYIFISYSHKDSFIVMQIIEQMISDGYRIWYDEGISPGTQWDDFIAAKIDASGLFIAFISENYLESDNCKDELKYSKDHLGNILLIYISKVKLSAGIELRFGRTQAIFAYDYNNADDFFAKIYSTPKIEYFNENITPDMMILLPDDSEPVTGAETYIKDSETDDFETKDKITKIDKSFVMPVAIVSIAAIIFLVVLLVITNKFSMHNNDMDDNNLISDADISEDSVGNEDGDSSDDTVEDNTVEDILDSYIIHNDGFAHRHMFEVYNLRDGETYYNPDDSMNYLDNTGAVYLGYLEGDKFRNGSFHGTDSVSVRVPALNGYSESVSISWYYIDECNDAQFIYGDYDNNPVMINGEMCYVSGLSGSMCKNNVLPMGTYYVTFSNPSDGTALTVTRFFYTQDGY